MKNRDAALHDDLVVTNFGTGTRGFADPTDCGTAICVKPGTEIAFETPIEVYGSIYDHPPQSTHSIAIFRQVNRDRTNLHHDCLELPDGTQIMLTLLKEGQRARILQLPAAPKNKAEEIEQRRVEYAG